FTTLPPPLAPIAAVPPASSQKDQRGQTSTRPQTAAAVDAATRGEKASADPEGRRGTRLDITV
ncbi:MAG: hypothetical protein GVY28_02260, partial [Alphaproteobacteria bacterium]|nr:hypothetical protein [Alphaproteobacteria bacterium]